MINLSMMKYLDSVGPPLIPLILAVSSLFLNTRKCSRLGTRGRYDSVDDMHQEGRPFISLLMITLAVIQFGTSLALVIVAYLMLGETMDMVIYGMWGLAWVIYFNSNLAFNDNVSCIANVLSRQ